MRTLVKEIKITDKNYGGTFKFYKDDDLKYFSCRTPENCFGYDDSIILASTTNTAYSLWRYWPKWIINRVEKELIKLTRNEGWNPRG